MRRVAWLGLGALVCIALVGSAREAKLPPSLERCIEVDELAPVIDSVICPCERPPVYNFVWCFQTYGHDEAPLAVLATPAESLEYWYAYIPPAPLEPIYPAMVWSVDNNEFSIFVDGLAYPGVYRFETMARDQRGNTSEKFVCEFLMDF
jgi:hypothetical protein